MMFTLAENEKIGHFLRKCIDAQYNTQAAFCREYLKISGEPTDSVTLAKMRNRLSQILSGEKGIQLEI